MQLRKLKWHKLSLFNTVYVNCVAIIGKWIKNIIEIYYEPRVNGVIYYWKIVEHILIYLLSFVSFVFQIVITLLDIMNNFRLQLLNKCSGYSLCGYSSRNKKLFSSAAEPFYSKTTCYPIIYKIIICKFHEWNIANAT